MYLCIKDNIDKMENEKQQIKQIEKAVKAMSGCTPLALSTALSILPDYMEDGASIVLAAAAHIIAERYPDRLDEFMEQFKAETRKHISAAAEKPVEKA